MREWLSCFGVRQEEAGCRCRPKARLTLDPRLTPDLEAEVVVQVAMDGGGALVLAGVSACSVFALLSLSSAYFSPAGFDAFLP
jgi:hypothetical protein